METTARQIPLFLDLQRAAEYTGLSVRWLRRHWVDLLREGVAVHRLPTPHDQDKGRIMFHTASLVEWLEKRRITELTS